MDAVLRYLSRITPYESLIVFVELLLIGIVVYWAVSFLEGTRGERLFRGVIFVLIIGSLILKLLVEQIKLERIELLYDSFVPIAILIIAISGYVSIASMTGAAVYAALSLILFWKDGQYLFIGTAFLTALFVFYTHRTNIARLLRGEEARLWDKVKQ